MLIAPVAITFGIGIILGPGFGQFARWFDSIVPWARYALVVSLAFVLVMLVVMPFVEYGKRNRRGTTIKNDRHDDYRPSGGGGWIGGGPAGFGSFGPHSGGGSFGGGGASGGW